MYIAFAVLGFITGTLALYKDRPIIVLATACSGSFLAIWCVSGLVGDGSWPSTSALASGADTKTPQIYYYGAGIVGASILTSIIQFRITAAGVDHRVQRGEYYRDTK